MEKLLDNIISVLFALAIVVIVFFIGQYIYHKLLGLGGEDDTTPSLVEVQPTYDYDIDDIYDDEDEDYYNPAESDDVFLPGPYDNAISDLETAQPTKAEEAEADRPLIEEVPSPPTDSPSPSSNSSTSSDDGLPYMVVAGSFSTQENAQIHLNNLKKKGYNSEIVQFDDSRMFTVVASRHTTKTAANAKVKAMKAKKIECYVHTKRVE